MSEWAHIFPRRVIIGFAAAALFMPLLLSPFGLMAGFGFFAGALLYGCSISIPTVLFLGCPLYVCLYKLGWAFPASLAIGGLLAGAFAGAFYDFFHLFSVDPVLVLDSELTFAEFQRQTWFPIFGLLSGSMFW